MSGMTGFVESEWTRRTTGEFAEHHRTAPEVTLAPENPTLDAQLKARRAHLRSHGYVSARSVDSANPYADVPAGQWWGLSAGIAEVSPSGYAVMSPTREDGGRSYLKRYGGDQTSLRMPSAHSIRAYAGERGTTFDVPVEATTPDGQVTGHVRVTDNGSGRWSVSPVAMPEPQGSFVAESVSAVLEARRTSRALPDVRDILARRRERIAAAGVKVREIENSSWISGMGYNEAEQQMVVQMNGRTYGYHVSPQAYEATRTAASPGQAYNRLVKGEPRFETAFHDDCGRYYNVAAGHRCASQHHAPGDVRERNAWLMRDLAKV